MDLDFVKHEDVLDVASEFIERRSETRYKMCDGVITVRKPHHSQSSRLGSAIDVSKGGMAFQYFIDKNTMEKKFNELDIYIRGAGLFLGEIPIKVTSIVEFPGVDRWSSTIIKRFGVQFLEFTENKKLKLKEFMENYTLHAI